MLQPAKKGEANLAAYAHPEPVSLRRLVGGVLVVLASLGLMAIGLMGLCAGLMLAGLCAIHNG
jgi:hypothetical protein